MIPHGSDRKTERDRDGEKKKGEKEGEIEERSGLALTLSDQGSLL